MASNLTIENLGKVLDTGDVDRFFSKKIDTEVTGSDNANPVTFSEILNRSLDDVNQSQIQADRAIEELVSGRTKNIHETMLAVERADVALKTMMQVRNKVLEAYREIMRMQV